MYLIIIENITTNLMNYIWEEVTASQNSIHQKKHANYKQHVGL